MKIVFFGTPDFAVPTLQTLINSDHQVLAAVTQPDKPKGRGGKMQFTPVKEIAVAADIPVYQPEKVKGNTEFIDVLKKMNPDVIVVVAFGQILPTQILQMPKYGCMNIHASLLPKLRGAAPIQWSVIQGDTESGVTIQQMAEGIDTGDILLVEKYTLDSKETGGSLFDKLAQIGGPLLLQALEQAEAGTLQPVPQNHEEHTYAKKLSKETGKIDFTKSAEELERLIRGLNPWPSAYTTLDGKMLKIWEAEVTDKQTAEEPGTVTEVNKDSFVIQTGAGSLTAYVVQLEGKKRMDAESFLRGYHMECGTRLV